MSDKPISVGDVVYVAHSCCGDRVKPYVFTVVKIKPGMSTFGGYSICSSCGSPMPAAQYGMPGENGIGQPLTWLKKIPPMDEKQNERHDEEITA